MGFGATARFESCHRALVGSPPTSPQSCCINEATYYYRERSAPGRCTRPPMQPRVAAEESEIQHGASLSRAGVLR